MGKRWYGSVTNRIDENRMFCPTIEVGTGVTEYLYSDRNAYEVTRIIDQKHVYIREYDVKPAGEPMSNNWDLISNPNNIEIEVKFRYKNWHKVFRDEKGKITGYRKMNLSFGRADYYYDYEF